MIDQKKVEAEREHRKREALRSAGECIEHLRVLQVLGDTAEDSSKIDRTHYAAVNLAAVIKQEL